MWDKGVGTRGFTLPELIASVVLMAALAGAGYAIAGRLVETAREREAVSRACALETAKVTFRLRRADANEAWASAATDGARYGLLRPHLAVDAPPLLADYAPRGFNLELGTGLRDRVVVRGPGGPVPW